MSVNDLRLNLNAPDHDKFEDLEAMCLAPLLKPGVTLAGGSPFRCFIRLLSWCAKHDENRYDGILRNLTAELIERRAKWTGPPGSFVAALKQLNLIEMHSGHFCIHDWEDHQRWLIHANARSLTGRKAATIRYATEESKIDEQLKTLGIDPGQLSKAGKKTALRQAQENSQVEQRTPRMLGTPDPSHNSKGAGCYPQSSATPDPLHKSHVGQRTPRMPGAMLDAVPNSSRSQSSSMNSSQSSQAPARASPVLPVIPVSEKAQATTANSLKNENDKIIHGILRGLYREDAEILRVLSFCRKWIDASDPIWLRRLVACAMIGVRIKPRCLSLYLQRCIRNWNGETSELNENVMAQAAALIREQQGLNEIQKPSKRVMDGPKTFAELIAAGEI